MGTIGIGENVSLNTNDNIENKLSESIDKGLEMIGLKAESYAKINITNNGSVDTGLLRNSIAHAIAGEQPSIGSNYRGSNVRRARTYSANTPDENGVLQKGTYSGTTPSYRNGHRVYIGTAVYYAPYVEMGHQQVPGRYVPALGKRLKASYVQPKPFLKPAFIEHMEEYEEILSNTLQEDMEEDNEDD